MRAPDTLLVMSSLIPDELQRLSQWVLWRWAFRGEKWTMLPHQRDGTLASSTNPRTWCSFVEAMAAYMRGGFNGLGFVVSAADPYVVVDLDKCLDRRTGEVDSWAMDIVNELRSYWEVSPTGTGLRCIAKAKLPAKGRRKGHF